MAAQISLPLSAAAASVITVARTAERCTVLGPGVRAVVWVQGCPFRCPGCVAPETLPTEGGRQWAVGELADWLLARPGIDGVTFSGGEPMAQAGAVAEVLDRVRAVRDFSAVAYTGYTLEGLRANGTADQHELLARLDVLIDGPFVQSRLTDLRWRGSDNQRVLFLTPRYAEWADRVNDRGHWLECEVGDGWLGWMGIPPAGFRPTFEAELARLGFPLSLAAEVPA